MLKALIRAMLVVGIISLPAVVRGDGVSEAWRFVNRFGKDGQGILQEMAERMPDKEKEALKESLKSVEERRKDTLSELRALKLTETLTTRQTLRARAIVDRYTSYYINRLKDVLETAPDEDRPIIEKAISSSIRDRDRILKRLKLVYEREKEAEIASKRRGLFQPMPVEREPGTGMGLMER